MLFFSGDHELTGITSVFFPHHLFLKKTFTESGTVFQWADVFSVTQSAVSVCLQCFDAVGWAAGRASGL